MRGVLVISDPHLAANVKPSRPRLRLEKAVPLVLLAAVLMALAPNAFGASTGLNSESATPLPGDFAERGCTSCHGGSNHLWAREDGIVTVAILDADGARVVSGAYEHDASYTITITLANEFVPGAASHAGFYLSAGAGEFVDAGDANVQITGGGLEASHTNPSATEWTVGWHAPEEGAVAFMLLVNDVDGSGAPDEGDQVYRQYFALTDEAGAQLGAVEEHEIHFGVALPQYWLGLIALASMVFVMLFAFVYLKFVSPHNSDSKDR